MFVKTSTGEVVMVPCGDCIREMGELCPYCLHRRPCAVHRLHLAAERIRQTPYVSIFDDSQEKAS